MFTGHPHKHNQQMKMGVSTICLLDIPTNITNKWKWESAQFALWASLQLLKHGEKGSQQGFPTKIRQMKIRAFLIGHPHKITNKWKCESASQLKVQRYAGIRYNQNVANDCWIICKKKPFPKTFNWTLSLIVDGLHL